MGTVPRGQSGALDNGRKSGKKENESKGSAFKVPRADFLRTLSEAYIDMEAKFDEHVVSVLFVNSSSSAAMILAQKTSFQVFF